MKLPLSNRLLACASFVRPGDRVADIGCDHGYLSIHLLRQGIARNIIASDINEGPLQSAFHNCEKFAVRDRVRFYLSDGFRNVPRDFDCAVCAGMGADTMMSIISHAPWLKDPKYRLILQCQSKRPELRQWLYDSGFRIDRETLAKDGKFVYTVMEVVYDPGHSITPAQSYISPQLLEERHSLLPEYYERVKSGIELTISGLSHTHDERLPVYQQILEDLTAMEAMIYGDRS